jgi:hypothetical protein
MNLDSFNPFLQVATERSSRVRERVAHNKSTGRIYGIALGEKIERLVQVRDESGGGLEKHERTISEPIRPKPMNPYVFCLLGPDLRTVLSTCMHRMVARMVVSSGGRRKSTTDAVPSGAGLMTVRPGSCLLIGSHYRH